MHASSRPTCTSKCRLSTTTIPLCGLVAIKSHLIFRSSLIFLLSVCLLTTPAIGATTDQIAKPAEDEGAEINLHDLTDSELESICASRGFELVREIDDATGEPISYSHDDYVDAARECLELEAEMEDFFQDNPNLLGDLQAETEAMMKEKEELERQLAAAQEQTKKENSADTKEKRNTFIARAGTERGEDHAEDEAPAGNLSDIDSASADTSEGAKQEMEDSIGSDGNSETAQIDEAETSQKPEDGYESVIDLEDESNENRASVDNQSTPKESAENADAGNATLDTESYGSDGHGREKEQNQTTESKVDTTVGPKNEGPLAFARLARETAIEFRDKVLNDLIKIGEIIVPKPLRGPLKEMIGTALRIAKDTGISAANLLKRYLIALLDSAKQARKDAANERKSEDAEVVPQ